MEGVLLIPPERGTISIGRSLWKPRFVVVGSPNRDMSQPSSSQVPFATTTRIRDTMGPRDVRPLQTSNKPVPDAVYLSIYKSKVRFKHTVADELLDLTMQQDDWEPIQQHSMASITACQTQMIAHRKQGPALPTLIVQLSPDPATDKLRKRRSSRTVGLTTTKDSGPTTLWFRLGDEQYNLQDWERCINSMIYPRVPEGLPMSPITPMSPVFMNPFSPRDQNTPDYFPRPSSGHETSRFTLHSSSPAKLTKAGRDRPKTLTSAESASLRSHRSDLSSSQTSSLNTTAMSYLVHGKSSSYTASPTDIPSPATTIGEYQGDYMPGMTRNKTRSSTVSSPARRAESISSQGPPAPILESSSPPPPRESILDRAFQLRCIPGSEKEVPGAEKLSSIARFEALMREKDEERKRQESVPTRRMTSTFEKYSSPKEEGRDNKRDDDDEVEDFEEEVNEGPEDETISWPSERSAGLDARSALRHSPVRQSTISCHTDSYNTYNKGSSSSNRRPHTAHPIRRSSISQRTSSPNFAVPPVDVTEEFGSSARGHDKRHTVFNSSMDSLSELTKRMSATGSLMRGSSNTSLDCSSRSSRGSNEAEPAHQATFQKIAMAPRKAPPAPSYHERDLNKDCHFQGLPV